MIDTISTTVTTVTAIALENISMTDHIMMIATLDIMVSDIRTTNILMRRNTMFRGVLHTLSKTVQKSFVLFAQE